MHFRRNLNKLALAASAIFLPVCASSTLKLVKEKLDALSDHKLLITGLGAATMYGVYKKNDSVRKKVDTSWDHMKNSARALCEKYNKPVTVGFWARTAAFLTGAYYAYNFDKSALKAKTQKKYEQASGYIHTLYSECWALSREKQLALTAGVASVFAATCVIGKKAISYIYKKDTKKAFLKFKASLTEELIKNNTALLTKIEHNAQVLCEDEARLFLTHLNSEQYELAEALLE